MTTQRRTRAVSAASVALAAIALIVAVSCGGAQTKATQTQATQTQATPTKADTQVSTPGAPLNPVGGQRDGPPVTPKPGGPLTPSAKTFKVDAQEFFLTPDDFVEKKLGQKWEQKMIYRGKPGGRVGVFLHPVPGGKPISASETYQRGQMSS